LYLKKRFEYILTHRYNFLLLFYLALTNLISSFLLNESQYEILKKTSFLFIIIIFFMHFIRFIYIIKSLIITLKNIKKYNINTKFNEEFSIKEFSKKYRISVFDSYLFLEFFIMIGEAKKIYVSNRVYNYNYKFNND